MMDQNILSNRIYLAYRLEYRFCYTYKDLTYNIRSSKPITNIYIITDRIVVFNNKDYLWVIGPYWIFSIIKDTKCLIYTFCIGVTDECIIDLDSPYGLRNIIYSWNINFDTIKYNDLKIITIK